VINLPESDPWSCSFPFRNSEVPVFCVALIPMVLVLVWRIFFFQPVGGLPVGHPFCLIGGVFELDFLILFLGGDVLSSVCRLVVLPFFEFLRFFFSSFISFVRHSSKRAPESSPSALFCIEFITSLGCFLLAACLPSLALGDGLPWEPFFPSSPSSASLDVLSTEARRRLRLYLP